MRPVRILPNRSYGSGQIGHVLAGGDGAKLRREQRLVVQVILGTRWRSLPVNLASADQAL
jgi:hypothetical protein